MICRVNFERIRRVHLASQRMLLAYMVSPVREASMAPGRMAYPNCAVEQLPPQDV